MKKVVIMAAGGSGSRMQTGTNKILLPLAGKSVIRRSMEAFRNLADLMVLSVRESDRDAVQQEISLSALPFPVQVVPGGKTRQESVLNALKAVTWDEEDLVLVHDAARCMVKKDVIERVIDSCIQKGSGVPAVSAVSTFKQCDPEGQVIRTIPRSSLYEIQTPQGFFGKALLEASEIAWREHREVTDDASIMELAGYKVYIVAGSAGNIKLTTREDYMTAENMLADPGFRIGTGYDVHRLMEGRRLVLCGVDIPWGKGLLGHSDADVALHALMDAMLGAAALGDIGKLFPDTDETYRDISSILLLKETARLISQAGYSVANADITIVAQKPKILPYIPQMRANIAEVLVCSKDAVNVKATTTEHLGFEGRMEGISAQAVCLLRKIRDYGSGNSSSC